MTTDHENAVNLAILQTEVSYLKQGMGDLKATNAQQNVKLDAVLARMDEARGGWRLLLLLGGASGTIGGAIAWVLSHWKA